MYIIIGKEGCSQCEELKELFKAYCVPHMYTDRSNIDTETHTYLKAYFPTYPMVLEAKWFRNFKDMKRHFTEF
jgi:hypothetical protein